MSAMDADVCRCFCHRGGEILHIVACCGPCQECGRRVRTSAIRTHRARHRLADPWSNVVLVENYPAGISNYAET